MTPEQEDDDDVNPDTDKDGYVFWQNPLIDELRERIK